MNNHIIKHVQFPIPFLYYLWLYTSVRSLLDLSNLVPSALGLINLVETLDQLKRTITAFGDKATLTIVM